MAFIKSTLPLLRLFRPASTRRNYNEAFPLLHLHYHPIRALNDKGNSLLFLLLFSSLFPFFILPISFESLVENILYVNQTYDQFLKYIYYFLSSIFKHEFYHELNFYVSYVMFQFLWEDFY